MYSSPMGPGRVVDEILETLQEFELGGGDVEWDFVWSTIEMALVERLRTGGWSLLFQLPLSGRGGSG